MKIVRIVLTALLVVAALAGGVVLGVRGSGWFSPPAPLETVSHSRSSQIIESVNREEQIVLLSLGIQGMETVDRYGTVFGIDVPWSGKTAYLPYSFTAKLGIEGKEVEILELAENHLRVSIPEFVFIGHADIVFGDLIEVGGVLSGTAEKINQSEMSNQILSGEHKAKFITEYRDVLDSQAEAFYSRIIAGIDPSIAVEFEHLSSGG